MGEARLTDFGLRIYTLAAERANITSWTALERELEELGLKVSRQQITNYANGISPASAEFVRYFSELTKLTEDEAREFAYMWACNQERAEGKGYFETPVSKVAQRVGWSDEEARDYAYRYIFGAGVLTMSA